MFEVEIKRVHKIGFDLKFKPTFIFDSYNAA